MKAGRDMSTKEFWFLRLIRRGRPLLFLNQPFFVARRVITERNEGCLNVLNGNLVAFLRISELPDRVQEIAGEPNREASGLPLLVLVGPRAFQTFITTDLTTSLLTKGRPTASRRSITGEEFALLVPVMALAISLTLVCRIEWRVGWWSSFRRRGNSKAAAP